MTNTKLPTSVTLLMSELAEFINNVRSLSSSYYLSFTLSLSGEGGLANMNLMNNNLVQRGLAEYKAGLLYILGIIIGRGKGCTIMGGGKLPS